MARKVMVTRTIKSTLVNVLCLDIYTAEPFYKDFTLPGTMVDSKGKLKEKAALKIIAEMCSNSTVKPVEVFNYEVIEKLYGMDEATFIANSVVLPPRTTNEQDAE